MDGSAEIKLYDNLLVLSGTKLLFENYVINDFDDRYHNVSSFGVEGQHQVFSQLVKLICSTTLPSVVKAQAIFIFANLFKVMSTRNVPTAILNIGESSFKNLYAQLLVFFGTENMLYEICHDHGQTPGQSNNIKSILVNDSNNIDPFSSLTDNIFSVTLIDLDTVKEGLGSLLDQCARLVSENGKIILYGSGKYDSESFNFSSMGNANIFQLNSDGYVISIDILEKENSSYNNEFKEQVLGLIQTLNSELLTLMQYIMSNHPTSNNYLWHNAVDTSIKIVAQIEELITQTYMIFNNKDLKFQTNEVKNALLDFKYEAYLNRKDYDFFQSTLFDCYNNWVDCIH
ncbi:hypothetical protein [Paenibacillus alvei]|uniref:Uncharacterized protein n=1 Tax=Paenibacillus alvei TaxID=44250 RepID=A0AAP6ZXG4_PAEAL|nr:hypothetical protein [Paenibacillus alvei]NOJ70685.1 hypothetical protein [Paenibacillus alvei]